MKKIETVNTYFNEYTIDELTKFINDFKLTPKAFGKQTPMNYGVCDWRIITDIELIYNISGTTYVEFNDKTYVLSESDLIIVPSFTPHKIFTKDEDIHTNYWLHFSTSPYYKQFELFNMLTNEQNSIIHIGDDYLLSLYEKLSTELSTKTPGHFLVFTNVLMEIILYIIRTNCLTTKKISDLCLNRFDNDRFLIEKCQSYIYSNLSKKITIDDLCTFLCISESKLYKSFSKLIGITPNQFILYSKLKESEILLLSSNLSIQEIASSLGFSSPYYYSNVFKKHYGLSPISYKHKNLING